MGTIRDSLRSARDRSSQFCTSCPGHILGHVEQLEAVITDLLDHPELKPQEVLERLGVQPDRIPQILALANWLWEGRRGQPAKEWPWETI